MATLSAIIAMTRDCIIGVEGKLPWPHLKCDMEHFKKTTMNGVVIMGRKTWESLPETSRPLKDRVNIVMSTDPDYEAPGAIVMATRTQVMDYVKRSALKCWVIGGYEIYELFAKEYQEVHITRVGMVAKRGTCAPLVLRGVNWVSSSAANQHFYEQGMNIMIQQYVRSGQE